MNYGKQKKNPNKTTVYPPILYLTSEKPIYQKTLSNIQYWILINNQS